MQKFRFFPRFSPISTKQKRSPRARIAASARPPCIGLPSALAHVLTGPQHRESEDNDQGRAPGSSATVSSCLCPHSFPDHPLDSHFLVHWPMSVTLTWGDDLPLGPGTSVVHCRLACSWSPCYFCSEPSLSNFLGNGASQKLPSAGRWRAVQLAGMAGGWPAVSGSVKNQERCREGVSDSRSSVSSQQNPANLFTPEKMATFSQAQSWRPHSLWLLRPPCTWLVTHTRLVLLRTQVGWEVSTLTAL